MPVYSAEMKTFLSEFDREVPKAVERKDLETPALLAKVQKVAQEAQALAQQISADPNRKSLQYRVDSFTELHSKLSGFADQIYKAKGFWQTLCYFFGCSPAQEKMLYTAVKTINALREKAVKDEARLWNGSGIFSWFQKHEHGERWIERFADQFVNHKGEDLSEEIKYAAFRLMGDHKFEGESLNGQHQIIAFAHLKADLHFFIQQYGRQLSETSLKELENLYKGLEKGYKYLSKFDTIRHIIHNKDRWSMIFDKDLNNPNVLKELLDKLIGDIVYEIQIDVHNLQPGEEFPLPTSLLYGGAGHGVVFAIKRQLDGNFSFTIVNTGDGTNEFESFLSTLFTSVVHGKFGDYTFKGASLAVISDPTLYENIIKNHANTDQNHSIKDLFNPLLEHFPKHGLRMQQEDERHAVQTNGTCSRESALCWEEKNLNPLAYKCLELYTTANAIKHLKSMIQHSQGPAIDNLQTTYEGTEYRGRTVLGKLLQVGQVVFEQRKKAFAEELERARAFDAKRKQDDLLKNESTFRQKIQKWTARTDPKWAEAVKRAIPGVEESYRKLAKQSDTSKPLEPPKKANALGFGGDSTEAHTQWQYLQKLRKQAQKGYDLKAQNKASYYEALMTRNIEELQRLTKHESFINEYAAVGLLIS